MREREPLVVGGLVVLLFTLWLGFLVHTSPRFAGSPWGGVFGVSGALLMLASLVYTPVKRLRTVKAWVTRRVSVRTVLNFHIFAGLLGAFLGLLHTGHKFDSPLGIALTAAMLLAVLSGYVGRYLMKQVALEVSEKRELLTQMELAYRQTAGELAANPEQAVLVRPWAGFWGRWMASLFRLFPRAKNPSAAARALVLAESMADLEYAIKTHESFRWWFGFWFRFHVAVSVLMYVFLALHVWAGVHYGLRWFA